MPTTQNILGCCLGGLCTLPFLILCWSLGYQHYFGVNGKFRRPAVHARTPRPAPTIYVYRDQRALSDPVGAVIDLNEQDYRVLGEGHKQVK